MPETIICPYCQRKLLFDEQLVGKRVQCPSCRSHFDAEPCVPLASPEPAAAPPFVDLAAFDQPPRPPVRRRSGIAGLAMVALFLLALGLWAWKPWAGRQPIPVPVPDDPEQRRREMIEAFQKQQPLEADEIARELTPLFDGLAASFRDRDREQMMSYFDLDRMFDELVAQEILPRSLLRQRRDFIRGMREGMGRSLIQQAPLLAWSKYEIRHIKKLEGNEAAVIVRHRAEGGGYMKMRWWVSKRPGTWKIFDMEDLDVGMRATTLAGSMLEAGGLGRWAAPNAALMQEATRGMTGLRDALLAVAVQQDADLAEKKLQGVADVKFPPKVEALRFLVSAMVRMIRGQYEESLQAMDQAERFHADMPCLDLFRGINLNALGRWDKALGHLEAYRGLLGEDSIVCREIGTALRGVRRFPEACGAYRKALDDDPKDADAFLGLLGALSPGDNRDDLASRFLKLDKPEENFDILAEDCRERRDGESLEQLAQAMRKLDPRHAGIDYYLCLAKVWGGRADLAVPLFQAAVAGEKDRGKRESYIIGFQQAMVAAGNATTAYAALPDPREAFRFLAAELKQAFQMDDLRELVNLHRKKHPDDVLLPFYQGEVHIHDGNYPLADKSFRAGLAGPPEAGTLELFRSSRVTARYHTGGALAAYAELGPKEDTFLQLAGLCFQDSNHKQLEALIDAHARADPKSDVVGRHRMRLRIRQDRTAEGIALFKESLARLTDEEERQDLVGDFLGEMVAAGKPLDGYQAAPDAVHAFRTLAGELFERRDHADLRRLLDVHRQRHADDHWLAFFTGQLFQEEEAWDKAAGVLGDLLKKAPQDLRHSVRWNYVFVMYKAGRFMQAYGQVEARDDTFQQLANLLAGDKRWPDLEALIAAHRPNAPGHSELAYFEARLKIVRQQPAEAAALIRKACENQNDGFRRRDYVATFVLDMQAAGLGLEGYRTSPDKPAAFETLARQLVSQKKDQDLEALLGEHGKAHPADSWLPFFWGELHLLRGDPDQAGKALAAALAKTASQNQWAFRRAYYRAMVKAGKTASTYQEAGPGCRTFEELAQMCIEEKNARQLEALLAAHRQAHPDDGHAPAWDLEVKWLNQDYDGAVKLLTKHRQDVFALPRFRWKFEDYLVRGLVKLKRTKEAVKEAEAVVGPRRGNPVLLVLAHAAGGDVKQTIAVVDKLKPEPFLLEDCYRDADLGPILRGDAFRAFRDRFPEPKGKEERIEDRR